MSTKTIKSKLAAVAVTSLIAGALSVIATPIANASYGSRNMTAVSTLWFSTTASTTGAVVQSNALASARSVGWVAQTSTNGTAASGGIKLASGLVGTGVVQSGARLALAVAGENVASSGVSLVVTGGTLDAVTANTHDSAFAGGTNATTIAAITPSVNGSRTAAVAVQAASTGADLLAAFTVSAAVGSTATISAFNGVNIDDSSSATAGTLIAQWTLTVAAASSTGVLSVGDSTMATQIAFTKATTASGLLAFDNTSKIPNGSAGAIYFELLDAYSSPITTGTATATATNGSTVNMVNTPAAGDAYVASTSFVSKTMSSDIAGGNGYIIVNQPVANAAGSTVVTLSHNGTVVGSKTLSWTGDAASITVVASSTKTSFTNGATASCSGAPSPAGSAGNVVYIVKDAAGNAITMGAQPTVSDATGSMLGATVGSGDSATAAHGCAYQTSAVGYGVTTMIIPSTTLNGAGTYQLKITNGAGVSIKSSVQNATVSLGGNYSMTASFDKAKYAPGDLAKLTITVKDVYGNPRAAGNVATGFTQAVASGFTAVGTACADTTLLSSTGTMSCTYAAGNTEGSYSFSINATLGNAQDPIVGTISIAAGTAVVSNADVLKSIVALIASINKQIQALQKLILKR